MTARRKGGNETRSDNTAVCLLQRHVMLQTHTLHTRLTNKQELLFTHTYTHTHFTDRSQNTHAQIYYIS